MSGGQFVLAFNRGKVKAPSPRSNTFNAAHPQEILLLESDIIAMKTNYLTLEWLVTEPVLASIDHS